MTREMTTTAGPVALVSPEKRAEFNKAISSAEHALAYGAEGVAEEDFDFIAEDALAEIGGGIPCVRPWGGDEETVYFVLDELDLSEGYVSIAVVLDEDEETHARGGNVQVPAFDEIEDMATAAAELAANWGLDFDAVDARTRFSLCVMALMETGHSETDDACIDVTDWDHKNVIGLVAAMLADLQ